MESNSDRAGRIYDTGANCAQAVAGAFCQGYGMSETDVLRLSGGLGGGVRLGEVCGAAIGGAMVVGMKYGATAPSDAEAKKLCNDKAKEFMTAFKQHHGTLLCRELLAQNGKKICRAAIVSAVVLLEQLGY
ncbi:MAG: C-GCAxxG-C-C family protein [Planctomycetes bacterium]|nr:C-GCAxxG-C-C family protein [Planctomycetota bacterium]